VAEEEAGRQTATVTVHFLTPEVRVALVSMARVEMEDPLSHTPCLAQAQRNPKQETLTVGLQEEQGIHVLEHWALVALQLVNNFGVAVAVAATLEVVVRNLAAVVVVHRGSTWQVSQTLLTQAPTRAMASSPLPT
jgi:hypothetical protein